VYKEKVWNGTSELPRHLEAQLRCVLRRAGWRPASTPENVMWQLEQTLAGVAIQRRTEVPAPSGRGERTMGNPTGRRTQASPPQVSETLYCVRRVVQPIDLPIPPPLVLEIALMATLAVILHSRNCD
jgi:hypothetical protein